MLPVVGPLRLIPAHCSRLVMLRSGSACRTGVKSKGAQQACCPNGAGELTICQRRRMSAAAAARAAHGRPPGHAARHSALAAAALSLWQRGSGLGGRAGPSGAAGDGAGGRAPGGGARGAGGAAVGYLVRHIRVRIEWRQLRCVLQGQDIPTMDSHSGQNMTTPNDAKCATSVLCIWGEP